MLNRLQKVWEKDWDVPRELSRPLLSAIAQYAARGPVGAEPYLLLGGTGTLPLRDEEDAHVLDVALSGGAHIIATMNFADFVSYRTEVRDPDRIAIYSTANSRVIIAHLFTIAEWIRRGEIVIP